jgi:hypothetical protein
MIWTGDVGAGDLGIVDDETEVGPLGSGVWRLRPEELVVNVVKVLFGIGVRHVGGVGLIEDGVGFGGLPREVEFADRVKVSRLESVVCRRADGGKELAGLRRCSRLVEPPTDVVKGAVLKHDDDDVLDLREYAGHAEPPFVLRRRAMKRRAKLYGDSRRRS